MSVFTHFDLFAVGLTVAATLVLGYSVYYGDTGSSTNRMFFVFSFVTALAGVDNYLSYQFADPVLTLWLLRGILFFALLQAFFLFEFFAVFPAARTRRSLLHRFVVIPIAVAAAVLALTPYGFSGVIGPVTAGQITLALKGSGFWLCAAAAFGFVVAGLARFWYAARGMENRRAARVVSAGTAVTLGLIVLFDLVIAMIFGDPEFVPYGAFFMLPLIASVAYAILGEHLLDIKVATTSLLVFVLSVVSFSEIIFAQTLTLLLFRSAVFALVLIFGVRLIGSVFEEVRQRARIEKLADELRETNERQEKLVHFISHEVKSYLTKDASAFAALAENDFGTLPGEAQAFLGQALIQTRTGVNSVMDILRAANDKKGTVAYRKEPFDLAALVADAVAKAKPAASEKGLSLSFLADESGAPYTFLGDKAELGDHVLRNLIENAIAYTPKGSILVSLRRADGKVVLSVKDTGVGITEEDKGRLFTEGGHGKESQKINVHSTGYGLYIAKNVVTAHGGTIRAESEGAGKGSTFTIELPAVVHR